MGSNPAALMGNLFLYYFKNKLIFNLKKSSLHIKHSINNTFSFVNYLCAISDNGLFVKYFKEIHLEGLELKKENIFSTKATFFDIVIMMKDHKISTKLYDKGDLFPFEIVLMLFVNSNIPSKIFCSTFGSGILRFARSTSYCPTF